MSIIWKDGEFLDGLQPRVFHDDGGLANGLSVFDSMRAENGVLIDAEAHFRRLVHDVETVLGIGEAWVPGFSAMTEAWLPLLSRNDLSSGTARIRTMVTGGRSSLSLAVSDVPSVIVAVAPTGPARDLPPLTCAVIMHFPRIAGCALENCKRADYSRALAARREAVAAGAEEAIVTSTNGTIACGATSNLFIEENGVLITPPLSDGVVAGITRATILREHNALEEPVSVERLRAADKVYLTNSFFGMRAATVI